MCLVSFVNCQSIKKQLTLAISPLIINNSWQSAHCWCAILLSFVNNRWQNCLCMRWFVYIVIYFITYYLLSSTNKIKTTIVYTENRCVRVDYFQNMQFLSNSILIIVVTKRTKCIFPVHKEKTIKNGRNMKYSEYSQMTNLRWMQKHLGNIICFSWLHHFALSVYLFIE